MAADAEYPSEILSSRPENGNTNVVNMNVLYLHN